MDTIIKYASPRQKEILKSYWNTQSYRKTANELGINVGTVSKAIKRVKDKLKRHGIDYSSLFNNTKVQSKSIVSVKGEDIPDHDIVSVSSLYNKEEELILQWVKTRKDTQNIKEKLDIFVESFIEKKGIRKKSYLPAIPSASSISKNELVVLPIGDLHLGMYAWIEETGDDYDCDIAEKLIYDSIDKLFTETTPREKCLVLSLGDWFHSDTVQNKTLASGNILDVDTRWQRVFRIGVRIMKHVIDRCLERFNFIDVMLINGNHDYHTSYALSLIMDAYYQNNDRVNVDLGVNPYRYYRYGKNLIGLTHGMTKESTLAGIMAADMPKEWGETKYRYWYIGHKHQHKILEYPGCSVEIFPTLASKDAWTNSMGYRSRREIHKIVLHKEFGEISRSIVNINMIEVDK